MPERIQPPEARVVQVGETFRPFETATQFLTDDLSCANTEEIPVLETIISFEGVQGRVLAYAHIPESFYNLISIPLGPVHVITKIDDTGTKIIQTPIFLQLLFEVKSPEEFQKLGQFECQVDFGRSNIFYYDCQGDDHNITEDEIEKEVKQKGSTTIRNLDLTDQTGHEPILPWDLEALRKIQMRFALKT